MSIDYYTPEPEPAQLDVEVEALKAEAASLRAEVERLREWNREIALNAREFVAENQRLRAANETWASAYHAEYYANVRLRAALREVMDDLTLISKNHWLPVGLLDDVIYVNARAALDGQPAPGKEEA